MGINCISFQQFIKLHSDIECFNDLTPLYMTVFYNLKTKKEYYRVLAFNEPSFNNFVPLSLIQKMSKPIIIDYLYLYPIDEYYYIIYSNRAFITISAFTKEYRYELFKYHMDLNDKYDMTMYRIQSSYDKINEVIDFKLFKSKFDEFYNLYRAYTLLNSLI